MTDAFDRRRILLVGVVVYGLTSLMVGLPGSFGGNLLLFAMLGINCGLVFIGSNTLVVEFYLERAAKNPLFLHLLGIGILSIGVQFVIIYWFLCSGTVMLWLNKLDRSVSDPGIRPQQSAAGKKLTGVPLRDTIAVRL